MISLLVSWNWTRIYKKSFSRSLGFVSLHQKPIAWELWIGAVLGKYIFGGKAITRCLSTTPHPIDRAWRGSILLICYIILLFVWCPHQYKLNGRTKYRSTTLCLLMNHDILGKCFLPSFKQSMKDSNIVSW